jgi:glycosyltransferase involved in cell wall biosynthesis
VTGVPAASIVVPCFNGARFLGEALDSLRQQTFQEWECIVVDDGSKDDSARIAETYVAQDSRFSCVHQLNRGPSAARNAGLALVKGQYVQLLDADDLLEAEKLQVHVTFLAQHPQFAMVYSTMRYFTDIGGVRTFSRGWNRSQRDWMRLWPDTTETLLVALVEGNTFPISAPLFRKADLEEVGYFDDALPSHEDWDFWLRWGFAGKRFHGLDAPGTRTLVREHAESLSRNTITMAETRLMVRERIAKRACGNGTLLQRNLQYRSYDECNLGAAYMAAGRWKAGARFYLRGLKGAPRKLRALRLLVAHLSPGWVLLLWRRLRWGAPIRDGC